MHRAPNRPVVRGMYSFFWFDTIYMGWHILHIQGCPIIIFKTLYYFANCIILSDDVSFTFANSEDPDEMQHCVAFHLSLHYLQKYSFRDSLRIQTFKRGQ